MATRSKPTTTFVCQDCGHRQSRWAGQCPACKAWNRIVEEAERPVSAPRRRAGDVVDLTSAAAAMPLAEIPAEAGAERMVTGIGELDRVLGGGIVPGSAVLVGGDPGVGKSTLAIQLAAGLAARGEVVLYVSGEEAAAQVRRRGERLDLPMDGILAITATDVDAILRAMKATRAAAVIVDSVQTVFTARVESAPGSVAQLREATAELITAARALPSALWLIGHVTKEGVVAGPRVLEHMVDTVLYFEGEQRGAFRILRAVKNRFGPTGEIGVFEMHGNGLVEVSNPSEALGGRIGREAAGSVISACIEGTRPMLVEIQALVPTSTPAMARRTSLGIDSSRVAMLAAVLDKHVGLELLGKDIFVNTAGGIRIDDPGVDLAVVAALASSFVTRAVPARTLVLGEVGLTGEVRPVAQVRARLREAARLGFTRVVLSAQERERARETGVEVLEVDTVRQAWAVLGGRS
ncbi:MAG TPA: DNA repair protein RadA [Candidatus Limnocylindrales bacterium]|nr:DNA repair protein RadA [Candidatus Limnocylindrales bacterium]